MTCSFLDNQNKLCGDKIDEYYNPTYCVKHSTMKCLVCDKQAIRACDEKIDEMVCGNLLCSEHFHLEKKPNQKKMIYRMQHGTKDTA